MAYFSNGTEGELYRERYCYRCQHFSEDGNRDCPVWEIHWLYAYGQNTNPELSSVLSLLIPMVEHISKDGIQYRIAGECALFLTAPVATEPSQ